MQELASSRPLRVLVVDDCPDTVESLRVLLSLWGHEVATAADGPAALAVAADFRPDLALLDIGLPGLDGCELAGRLRRLPGLARVRLWAATGYGQPRDRARTQAAGFEVHLLKPFDLSALEALLVQVVPAAVG